MFVTLALNNQPVQVPEGATVLDAINTSGAYIPQLCKDPDMKPIGACGTCMVQIEAMHGFPADRSVPARDGMVVWTETPDVFRIRGGVLELTLGMLPQQRSATRYASWSTALTTELAESCPPSRSPSRLLKNPLRPSP